MTTTTTNMLVLAAVLAASPFVIYLCAKLGTYGALVGRRRFERDFPKPKRKGTDDEE